VVVTKLSRFFHGGKGV